IYQYYCQIAAKSDIPIIVYNIPSRCGINIEPQTLERLAKIDTIVALKECNSAQARLGPLTLLCGDDVSLLSMMALGGKGAIASTANFVPKKMVQLIDLCLGNDFNTARSLYYELLPLFEAGGWESNPIPCKMMMDLLGLEAGVPRFPLLECTKEDELRRLLWKLGYLADRDGSPKPTANC
ncbi:MAG: dihydrodipicolinate synthase family protein, partial [Chlamydiae bacterium]|nr:dihydrodipicolinate synthase family protein [Chlamydiota bacterium]